MRLQVLLGRLINRNDGFPGSSLGFWETAHLPLPSANINTLGQNVGLGEG